MKAKRLFLIMFVLMFVLTAAAPAPRIRTLKFTVINKSGGPISIRLTPLTAETQETYYLNIAEGSKAFPMIATYTVQPNQYSLTTTFFKTERLVNEEGVAYLDTTQVCALWDYPNLEYTAPTVDLTRNNEVVILPCNQRAAPANLGEPGHLKYWYPGYVGFVDESAPTFKWNWIPVWDYVY